jgi:hypothetical protein
LTRIKKIYKKLSHPGLKSREITNALGERGGIGERAFQLVFSPHI